MFTVFTEHVHRLFTPVHRMFTEHVHRVVHPMFTVFTAPVHRMFTQHVHRVNMFTDVHRIDHLVNVHHLFTDVHRMFTTNVLRVVHLLLNLRILAAKFFPERLEFGPIVLLDMVDVAEPKNLFHLWAILADYSDVLPAFLTLFHLLIVVHIKYCDLNNFIIT